ncbi:MAG: FG-GAP-like repeat-containing protein [Nanoarchaeota archaeon]|nr:FG-GAP-like repeat-containing protein [Nanoarchaeota archaeon]
MIGKRQIFFCLLFFILGFNFVVANTYLNESSTWQDNLIAVHFASMVFGDLDGDTDLDLVIIGHSPSSKVYVNNGTTLVENTNFEQNLTSVHYGSLALGDIDNDGDLDLASMGCRSGGGTLSACDSGALHSFIYINNGTGFIWNSSWDSDLTQAWKGSIAFGDVDLDGDLDLAMNGFQEAGGRFSKIYINNGTGFKENSIWQQGLTALFESSLAWGDVDNDNDLDLITVGDKAGSTYVSKVYINNATSLEENSTWQKNLLGTEYSSISLGDFNNDGKVDLTLIGHTSTDNHEIYNNTGTTFKLLQSELTGTGSLIGIYEGSQAFGDYDNDGDLDLITTGKEGHTTLYLYDTTLNNFTDKLNDPETGLLNLQFGSSIIWVDLDQDNDLDLIETGFIEEGINANRIKVYLNNITTPNTKPAAPTNFSAVYRDGKLTLTWTNASDTETPVDGLYYNLRVGAASKSHSIVSGMYGGGDDNGYFGNMMQRKSITLTTPLNVGDTVFYAVQTIDTSLANGSWSLEQSYVVPQDTTTPTITLNAPTDFFNTSNPVLIFNATVFDDQNLTNVTLYGNWTGSLSINETNSTGIINNTDYLFTKNLTSFGDGVYSWLYAATDSTINNTKNSTLRIFRIDTTAPIVNISSPLNGSIESSTNSITFTYNVTDADIANCSLYIDNAVDQTSFRPAVKIAQTFVKSFSNAIYQWNVNCTDYLGFQNGSLIYQFKVDYSRPSGGVADSSGSSSSSFFSSERAVVKSKTGEAISVSFTKDAAITDITITANKDLSIPITVQEVSSVDSSVAAADKILTTGSVYAYLSINAQTDKENIEHAQIKFKVPLSWFAIHDYDADSVILRRYTEAWESLPTKEVERGLTYAYYEAESSGFSLFAITAEKKVVGEAAAGDTAATEIVTEKNVTDEIKEAVEEIIPEKKVPVWFIAAVIITGLGYLGYYFGKKR